jgi:hypothetical protein
MATFLELVRDLARESGTLAGGVQIGTLTNVTGRADKLAAWVRKAWINIQNERQDWPWMRREFQSSLAIGVARYTGADLRLVRFSRFIGDRPYGAGRHFATFTLWDPAEGQADEGAIQEIDYDLWRVRYGRGAQELNRPTVWARSHLQELCLGAIPDKAYAITGEYRVLPQVLTSNDDVPELPVEYHNAILLEALKLLGISDESPQTASSAISEYVLARQNLNRDYLPELTIGGGPLA